MKNNKDKKRNWIVTIKCIIRKEVYCNDCSKQDARDEPWKYAIDEQELDQMDWEVLGVEENV